MVSCGQYFRASIRRQLVLPPLWMERRSAGPVVRAIVLPAPVPAIELGLEPAPLRASAPPREPVVARAARIDLAGATSAMDAAAARSKAGRIAEASKIADHVGRVPCRCGARYPGHNEGFVPHWFGRDCIERD